MIGPAWPDANAPGYIETNRDAVAAAAGAFGAVFVDPLAQGWFVGATTALIDPDGVRPTAEGDRYLADLIGPVVERTLFWRSVQTGRSMRAVRMGDYKLVVDANHAFVFDVRKDPAERDDLASKRTDIARSLRQRLDAWEKDVDREATTRK